MMTSSASPSSQSAPTNDNNINETTLHYDNDGDGEPLVLWKHDTTTKVGTLTLNSPKNYNALNMDMGVCFAETCRRITDAVTLGGLDCRAIVLEGAGDDAFSSGGNLDWLASFQKNPPHMNVDVMQRFYRYYLTVRTIPVPVIAALHGPAMGAGAGLALACDLRTAAPRPKILGLHFARLGMHTGMGGSHWLEQALGGPTAAYSEIMLLGKVVSGDTAYGLGLVNRLAVDAKAAAHDLAREMADHAHPVAVRTMLETIRSTQNVGLDTALQREALSQAVCYQRRDWGEGLKALVEKRSPRFDGYFDA